LIGEARLYHNYVTAVMAVLCYNLVNTLFAALLMNILYLFIYCVT